MSTINVNNNLPAYAVPEKSVPVAYVLLFLVGFLGVHQFYLGKTGRGLGYLLTFGWFTFALWLDLFTLASQVRQINTQRRVGTR